MRRPERNTVYDQDHFAELFESYKNLVYKTASLMLADTGEAEEALQEVFLQVYRSLHTYDPAKGAITTWLHRITINYCLDQQRKRRLVFQPLEEENPTLTRRADGTGLDDGLEREAVLQAIHSLSDKLRSVVILRYYWELPYQEIAHILDVPLGTVKSRIDLALRTLSRQILAHEQERPDGVDQHRR